jgi:hypothetical protein
MENRMVLSVRENSPADVSVGRLFRRDLGEDEGEFRRSGHVVLRDVVDREFLAYCDEALRSAQSEGSGRHIPGKKTQFLLAWPPIPALRGELFAAAAKLLQSRPEDIVLSERHFHLYAADAPSDPLPHKDRAASQIAIGIPLACCGQSELILFPDESEANTLDNAVGLRRALGGSPELVDAFMARTRRVRLRAGRGDAVVFLGSRYFHERYNAAGSIVLYLKLNNFGSDPLNENIAADGTRPSLTDAGARIARPTGRAG